MNVPQPKPYWLMGEMRRAIISGRYAPGMSLREEALEAEFGVSRGPIREALRLLELRGLVVHAPRRGFRVRTYSASTIEDLYRLRAMLERHAVECLARTDVSALLDDLDASNERMARHFERHAVELYLAENVTFHSLIVDASGNEPLKRTLAVLNEVAEPLRFALLTRDRSSSRSVAEHQRITQLIRDGRIDAAAAATEMHILASLPAVLGLAEKL